MKFFDHTPQHERLKPEIDQRVQAVMQHGQFINGPEVKELERHLAEYVGVKHCIACANGTDALELALASLDLKQGDEVITTAYSYFATAEAIERMGLKPVFVDIDPKTHNIDPSKIKKKITDRTKAILPVSLFGQCYDFKAINTIAEKHQLPVIEDGAQSFGATRNGKKSLSQATIGCTSFFPTKPLGCYGDGGACFTNDDAIAEKMRIICNHGQKKLPHVHLQIGRNSRLDTLQAAVLLAKLPSLDQDLEERRTIAERYNHAFINHPLITIPAIDTSNQSVYAQYCIQVPHRDAVRKALVEKNVATETDAVPTQVYYPLPLSMQPIIRKKHGHSGGDFPNAETASIGMLGLPIYPGMPEQDQQKVIDAVIQTVEKLNNVLPKRPTQSQEIGVR